MVVVVDSCLKQADSQSKSRVLVWWSAAAWRCSTFIKWTEWSLAITLWSWLHVNLLTIMSMLCKDVVLVGTVTGKINQINLYKYLGKTLYAVIFTGWTILAWLRFAEERRRSLSRLMRLGGILIAILNQPPVVWQRAWGIYDRVSGRLRILPSRPNWILHPSAALASNNL